MADSKLFTVTIGEDPSTGLPCTVAAMDVYGNRHYVRHDRVNYGTAAFGIGKARKGAAIEIPEVERTGIGSRHWRAKGSPSGAVAIPESELDRLITIGAIAMAVKLELAKVPTLDQDLDSVLESLEYDDDTDIRDAVARLRAARTAKKLTVSS
ncbi:hypothetical protein IU485_27610 [Nocardia cyriacigeorgica]|uniref:hypothetical protein n=1 Tax=Nocardia cyriacigeorgica TaxID=135487 RepID=UPI0018935C0F|nr:hypothetical protein [Nocardia cyriacigeorgica]MBF6085144.1 hypothetical protein [Nocardia cyriacigeorgica]